MDQRYYNAWRDDYHYIFRASNRRDRDGASGRNQGRGNLTYSSQLGAPAKNIYYDIGRNAYAANDGQNHSVSLPSAGTNYAPPSVITANSDSNSNQNATVLLSSMSWGLS